MFYDDLARGKHGEHIVAAALTARGHKVIDKSDDWEYRRKDIDFIITNSAAQETTLEIKTDAASERTGNLYIEYYNVNNKSHSYNGWLFYCGAEYIGFLQEGKGLLHICSLLDLRENIEKNNYRSASSADSRGYLLPIGDIQKFPTYQQINILV